LLKRYKRFLADVKLDSGKVITALCPNTGSMKSCCEIGRPGRMDLPNSSQNIYVSLPDEDSVAVVDTSYDDVVATIHE
jgi:DNA-binding sugar fermentation-stimulating protein